MVTPRLLLVTGQEGAGKSTLTRALLPRAARAAALDGEDVGQVHPFDYDDAFRELHRRNVAQLARNFWDAGYPTVIAGSFLRSLDEYLAFRPLLPGQVDVAVLTLLVRKPVRDRRRVERVKVTTQEWRDMVDDHDQLDERLSRPGNGFRPVVVDSTHLDVDATVETVVRAVPEFFGP